MLSYSFKNKNFLKLALTHSSSNIDFNNYERLEFLGDSIISFVVSKWLFLKYPNEDLGDLSKKKSLLVSRDNLSLVGEKLQLINYAYIGKSINLDSEPTKNRMKADLYESIVAAIFIDSNYENVKFFIENTLLNKSLLNYEENYKSQLNESCYKDKISSPVYSLIDESGPDHIKAYKVQVLVNNQLFFGTGTRIKDAEKKAAKKAFLNIFQA